MTEIIGVRFKSGGKMYYFNPNGTPVQVGQHVVIETAKGIEFGECVQSNTMVDEMELVTTLRPMLRIATQEDFRQIETNREREKYAYQVCQEKIIEHNLEMKLVDVKYSFDGSKVLFFFTADGRVDFRSLVKDLASIFRTRIELRQIGVRDEAKMMGGLGICGRPFCCSQFLEDFQPVSIKMAKTQNISLNPTKISGSCGRLMCCLKYEQDAYEDLLKHTPKLESLVKTPDGVGTVNQVNLLREQCKVTLDEDPDTPRIYRNNEIEIIRSGKGKRPVGYELPEKQEDSRPAQPPMPQRRQPQQVKPAAPVPEATPPAQQEEKPKRTPRRKRPARSAVQEGQSASASQAQGEKTPAPAQRKSKGETQRRQRTPRQNQNGEEQPQRQPRSAEGENKADGQSRTGSGHRRKRVHHHNRSGANNADAPKTE